MSSHSGSDVNKLDLLFCLAVLEAQAPRTGVVGPVLDLYWDLLDSIRKLRANESMELTHAAISDRLGAQQASLLSWIQSSCCSEIHPLGHMSGDTESPKPLLFWVPSGPTDREKKFQELKTAHGSAFAFHGSAPGNWLSILRYGLRSLSESSLMSHGAVHGDGVYLSPDSSIAAVYSRLSGLGAKLISGNGNSKLQKPEELRILALCEVVQVPSPGLKHVEGLNTRTYGKAPIWVAAQDGIVAVRLLIVFPQGVKCKLPSADDLAKELPSSLPERCKHDAAGVDMFDRPRIANCGFAVASVKVTSFKWCDIDSKEKHVSFFVESQCGEKSGGQVAGVWRRYSQFEKLRDRIGYGPRAPFPEKWRFRSLFGLQDDKLEIRQRALNKWLKELASVACHGLLRAEVFPELYAFFGNWGVAELKEEAQRSVGPPLH